MVHIHTLTQLKFMIQTRMRSTRRVYHLCTTFVKSPDNTQEMEQYTFGKQCGNENENPADNSVKHFTMKVAT